MKFWTRKPKPFPKGLRDIVGAIPSSVSFRRDPATQSKALELLSSPVGHLMLSIVRNESPMRTGAVAGNATEIQIARAYGVQEGYEEALKSLAALAEPVPDNKPIEETFEDPYKD